MPYERSGLQKVPEQIACILACIAVRYLHSIYRVGLLEQKRKINNITGFFHVLIDISRMENGKKKHPYSDVQSHTRHACKMKCLLA